MLPAQILAVLSVLSASVLAAPAPAPQNDEGCIRKEYIDINHGDEYDESPEMVSGHGCISDKVNTCSIANSATHTKSMSWSIGGSAGGSMDFKKIWSAVSGLSWDVSFSESDATGITTTANCPKGGIKCGLQVVVRSIKITGKEVTYKKMFSGNSGTCSGSEREIGRKDWETVNTVLEGEGQHNARMDFRACARGCADGNDCQAAIDEAGIPKCPGS